MVTAAVSDSLEAKLEEARREAKRWQRKYRELQRIIEQQQAAEHELHVAQAQRAQSAKQMLQLASREHVKLGEDLGALDSDLDSVVRSLAASLAAILGRAFDGADSGDALDREPPLVAMAFPSGDATDRPSAGHARAAVASREVAQPTLPDELRPSSSARAGIPIVVSLYADESAHPATRTRVVSAAAEEAAHSADEADGADERKGGEDSDEREDLWARGAHEQAHDADARREAGAEADRLLAPPHDEREGDEDEREKARDEAGGTRGAEVSAALAPSIGAPKREPHLRLTASSVFLASGAVPADEPRLLLELDLLGVEGAAAELQPTADAGVYSCAIDKTLSLRPATRARARVASALTDDDARASNVPLVLLAFDSESEPTELGRAVLNLEELLEGGRDLHGHPLAITNAANEQLGTVTLSVHALDALREIDRALDTYGSAAAMLEAELEAERAAEAANGGAARATHSPRLPTSSSSRELEPLAEEGTEMGSESLSRAHSTGVAEHEGADGGARAPSTPGGHAAGPRRAPQELLSPELQRLRARFTAAEQEDEWATIALAGDAPRAGMALSLIHI